MSGKRAKRVLFGLEFRVDFKVVKGFSDSYTTEAPKVSAETHKERFTILYKKAHIALFAKGETL